MTTLAGARNASVPIRLLFLALIVVAVAACGGGARSDAAESPAAVEARLGTPAPMASVNVLAEGGETADAPEITFGADGGGEFNPTSYVDADDLARILGEVPEPDCTHSSAFVGDACTWAAGDGSATLEVEFYRDPNLATRDAYVEHMETIMSSGSVIDDLGEAAFGGRNPLGAGSRITVLLGDGVHMWVSIAKEGDDQAIYDEALELARTIVALQ